MLILNWLEIHIDTNHAGLEAVEAMLSSLDVDGVVIDDETEFREFLEDNRQYWDYVDEDLERRMEGLSRVTFYLQADEAGFAKLGEVRIALEALRGTRQDCGSLIMSLNNLADEDWENNWKQYYKPIEIGERLLVIPKWEQADPGDRVPLYLDPGLTFGTGDHATTRLCLAALEKTVRGGERVLDLGCGSGILSIAALKLGAAAARAGQQVNYKGIADDAEIDQATAKNWLHILEALGIVFLLRPYSNNVLKRTVSTPKLYFYDTGLVCYLTRWSSPETAMNGAMNGALLENYTVAEIVKTYQNAGQEPFLYYYRDKDAREIDLLLEQDGKLFPIEIKKMAAPPKKLTKVFELIGKSPLERGTGAVLCMADRLGAFDQDNLIVPISLI